MQIAGYEVSGELGRGGMAVVYKARQSSLGRDVAIKVISAELSQNTEFKRRFLREAKTIANLHHPNIIKVFDTGEVDGRLYYVMEYHGGGTLEGRAGQGLSRREALRVFGKLAEALAEAHAQDYIHRDVKAANVLFSAQNEPVLSDFGIARRMDSNTLVTAQSVTMGTPAYMAPELFQKGEASAQSDIYALGVILYELLTGKLPFKAPTYWAYGDLHCRTPVPSLEGSDQAFQGVLERMLAKEPEARYGDLHAMLAEWNSIDAVADAGSGAFSLPDVPGYTAVSEQLPGRTTAPPEQSRKPVFSAALAGAVTVVVLGVGAALIGGSRDGADDEKHRATDGLEGAVIADAPSKAVSADSDPFEAMSEAVFFDDLNQLEDRFASMSDDDRAIGQCGIYVARYRINRSKSDLVIAEDYCKRGAAGPPLRVAEINGWLSFFQGDYAQARIRFEEALAIDDASADAHWGLAEILDREGAYAAAETLYAEAAVISPGNWRIQNAVGVFLYSQGRLPEARRRLTLALSLSPENIAILNNLGIVHLFEQDYASAVSSWDQVLASTPSRQQGPTLMNLGNAYYLMGDFTGARVAYEKAAELVTNDYRMWANVGDAYAFEGNPSDADQAYRRALDRAELTLGEGSRDPHLLAGIASLQAALTIPGADVLLREALEALPQDPEINRLAALTYLRLGDRAMAQERLQVAISSGYPDFLLYDDVQFKGVLDDNTAE